MKILFIHDVFDESGVIRSVLNNVKGLRELSGEIEFIFAGSSFVSSIPEYVEKRYIDWGAQDIVSQIQEIAEDADFVIIENPTVGLFPKSTLAFKEYAEQNPDKKIIYRVHDFIDDRPSLFDEFKKVFDNFDDIYPVSNNVSFLTLTSFDKKRLIKKGLTNVNVLPNSIVVSDLCTNKEKALDLRKTFEEKGIVNPGEKILVYPVRVLRRKNIEEAILLTKILNQSGEEYKLIVTLPYEEEYKREIENLASDYNVSCSVGKVSKHISFSKKDDFTIADLYSISELVISTSIREGFGFAFIEPWITGIPLIGRKISYVTEDFEINGIDLSHLYDNSILHNSEDPKKRMDNVITILSNPEKFREVSKKLDLKNRIKKSLLVIESNREAIKNHYDHLNVAKQLLRYITTDFNKHIN